MTPSPGQISHDSESVPDVHIGADGWLFLIGGSNDVLKYYTTSEHFSEQTLAAWIDLLRRRQARAQELGCSYCHLAVPEKLTVYPEHYGHDLAFERAPSCRLGAALKRHPDSAALAEAYVDLLPFFDIQKANGIQLYYKTDTHWTFEGAFSAYQLLCYRMRARTNDALLNATRLVGEIALDLGSKLAPPVRERFVTRKLLTNAKRVYANSLVAFKEQHGRENDGGLHVGSHVIFSSEAQPLDQRRIVVFGDSFAEYRDVLLTGLLAETFAETHFVWSAQIDWDYVKRVRPDILVTELAERFMNHVPHDEFDIEAFAATRLAAAASGHAADDLESA